MREMQAGVMNGEDDVLKSKKPNITIEDVRGLMEEKTEETWAEIAELALWQAERIEELEKERTLDFIVECFENMEPYTESDDFQIQSFKSLFERTRDDLVKLRTKRDQLIKSGVTIKQK